MTVSNQFLQLERGTAPAQPTVEEETRLYADVDGSLRTIQSDGTDAAVGGGGGSGVPPVTVYLTNGADGFGGTGVIVPNTIAGDGTTGGQAAGQVCGVPLAVAALADVLHVQGAQLSAGGTITSTDDDLVFNLGIYVTDLTGTNVAMYNVSDSISGPVTDTSHTLQNSDDHWTIVAGTDLVPDAGALTSTAGGIYVVTVRGSIVWD